MNEVRQGVRRVEPNVSGLASEAGLSGMAISRRWMEPCGLHSSDAKS
jgi:hypothetical protein